MKINERRYLGDGVYVTYLGYAFVLTTGTHVEAEASNVIVLEDDVQRKLLEAMGK